MFSIIFASPKPDNKIGLYNVFFLIHQVFPYFFVVYLLFLYIKNRYVYDMGINVRFTLAVSALLIILVPVVCVSSVTANPIPVYPDPEPVFLGPSNINSVPILWILFVFIIVFRLDARLSALALPLAPFTFVVPYLFTRRLRERLKAYIQSSQRVFSWLDEIFYHL